ncbi:hypothetical protein BKA69DRAFT_925962 [Paraphysoderma sedebokerense]|nr:hypothetical protein BKA69DRAFT_925962 [Paraphysoderma sedebokerense]
MTLPDISKDSSPESTLESLQERTTFLESHVGASASDFQGLQSLGLSVLERLHSFQRRLKVFMEERKDIEGFLEELD